MSIFDFATGDFGVLNEGVNLGIWIAGEIYDCIHGCEVTIQEENCFFAVNPSHFAGDVIDIVENEAFFKKSFFDSLGTIWS